MAMGTRKSRERQEPLWYGTELPAAPGHVRTALFDAGLNNSRSTSRALAYCGQLQTDGCTSSSTVQSVSRIVFDRDRAPSASG